MGKRTEKSQTANVQFPHALAVYDRCPGDVLEIFPTEGDVHIH